MIFLLLPVALHPSVPLSSQVCVTSSTERPKQLTATYAA